MSKSTLTIRTGVFNRTVEVPCRLPDSFTFKVVTERFGLTSVTAWVSIGESLRTAHVGEVEANGDAMDEILMDADRETVGQAAERVLADAKAYLGFGPDVFPSTRDVLTAIATAYEAEGAAYDAAVKAHAALPRRLHSSSLLPTHPSESALSPAVLMLAKYVEYVFEEACAAQTERAEQAAKPSPVRCWKCEMAPPTSNPCVLCGAEAQANVTPIRTVTP